MDKIIVCDIGGTNSKFACFSKINGKEIRFESETWEKTHNFNSFEELLEEIKKRNGHYEVEKYNNFVIAVPGPVTSNDLLSFPNVKWKISKFNLSKLYPDTRISIINDFIAQAYGCLTEASADALPIIERKTSQQTQNDIAIVGAGTGTGHGALKKLEGTNYFPLPSEAGHIPFPFITNSEFKFRDFLVEKNGYTYPVCNDVVSGPGLSQLHQFLTGRSLYPREVVMELTTESETTRWFSKFYARSCKNYSMTVLTSGGELFVSGGVAIKNPFLVDNDTFRHEFMYCSSKLDDYLLKSISVYLIRNEKIGLWGAAYYAFEVNKQK
jgi:glucokinase